MYVSESVLRPGDTSLYFRCIWQVLCSSSESITSHQFT